MNILLNTADMKISVNELTAFIFEVPTSSENVNILTISKQACVDESSEYLQYVRNLIDIKTTYPLAHNILIIETDILGYLKEPIENRCIRIDDFEMFKKMYKQLFVH